MVLRYVLTFLATCAMAKAVRDVKCKEKQDIGFVLDSTGTMIEQGLVIAESLALDITNSFTIGENNTRIALMTFGKESSILFHFDTYYTKEEITLAISSHDGSNVSTASLDKAFKAAKMLFGPSFGARDEVSRFMIFFTNGLFKVSDKVSGLHKMVAYLREMNIKILVAGVGTEVNKPRLEKIVENKASDIVTAQEFNGPLLIRRIHEVTDEFCGIKEKMKANSTTSPPTSVAPTTSVAPDRS